MDNKVEINFEHTSPGSGLTMYVVTVSHKVYLSTTSIFEAQDAFKLAKRHRLNATLHEVTASVLENYNGSYGGSDYNIDYYED